MKKLDRTKQPAPLYPNQSDPVIGGVYPAHVQKMVDRAAAKAAAKLAPPVVEEVIPAPEIQVSERSKIESKNKARLAKTLQGKARKGPALTE